MVKRAPYNSWRTRAPVGGRFGIWTIMNGARRNPKTGQHEVKALCDCGTKRWQYVFHLIYGESAGCMKCRRLKITKHFINYRGVKRSLVSLASPKNYRRMYSRIRRGIPPKIAALEDDKVCVFCHQVGHTANTKFTCETFALREEIRKNHPGVSRQRIKQLLNKAMGKCTQCGKPVVTKNHCARCAKEKSVYTMALKRRKERKNELSKVLPA